MTETEEKIERLQTQLDKLVKTQVDFQREVSQIRYEISVLRAVQQKRNASATEAPVSAKTPTVNDYVPPSKPAETPAEQQTNQQSSRHTANPNFESSPKPESSAYYETPPISRTEKSDLEKFIGENLISKIGIVILVIGVAIGAKYAIDNNLISPLTRIILGYIFGFGLLGFAVKLKPKYHNFSAVLLSGAMAIMYFITYFAHSLYELFSQSSAFALMLIFTVFTVAAAINYSRQVIAHIGLVGAYAIPFLLSNNSGNFAFLFSYIAITNVGILAISIKKYWKPLFYSSFIFTWATYYGWYLTSFRIAEHFSLGLLFLTVFFLIFYLTFIAYKAVSKENVAIENIVLILANSFIFYGVGYSILDSREGFENYLGMFTVLNAAIHFAFAFTISRLKLATQDLIYLLAALVLTFATIAIPVQLDGNWVTLLWTTEASILFWLGRAKSISLYEIYSYPLMLLAASSLLHDWQTATFSRAAGEIATNQFPLFNSNFVTSLLFAAAFAFIFYTNKDERYESDTDESLRQPFGYVAAAVALGVFYNAFRMEIADYFYFQSIKTAALTSVSPLGEAVSKTDGDLSLFSIIWQINYTMLFLTILSFVNMQKLKSVILAFANLALNAFVLTIFITVGLYLLGELRESYLLQTGAESFNRGSFHILIRYVSYAFAAALLTACYRYFRQKFVIERAAPNALNLVFDFAFYISLLFVLSAEVITWTDIFGYRDSHKLGLSILWGSYALMLIIVGIYQHKKHLRVGAIALFGITLAKLFFYDIAELDTISKTVVFVSLGILMLIVSFLYNKYKSLIFDSEDGEA